MYTYAKYKKWAVSEDGQRQFLSIRDRVNLAIKDNGCITMDHAIKGESGLNFEMLACVDRLVELGEILEVKNPYSEYSQHRIFVDKRLGA